VIPRALQRGERPQERAELLRTIPQRLHHPLMHLGHYSRTRRVVTICPCANLLVHMLVHMAPVVWTAQPIDFA
jgi:hypothetical protein